MVSSEWAFLRSFLRKTHNKEVLEFFREDDPELDDISTGSKAARRACLIKPKDSQNIALIKVRIFEGMIRDRQDRVVALGLLLGNDTNKEFSPNITFFFQEDALDVLPGKDPIRRQFSVRILSETAESWTSTKSNSLAVKIRQEFAVNNGLRFRAGKILTTYTYGKRQDKFPLLTDDKESAVNVIQKVCSVFGFTYNSNKVSPTIPEKDSITNPVGTRKIAGRTVDEPRWRPVATVRFQYATLTLYGLRDVIVLVDRSARFIDALQTA